MKKNNLVLGFFVVVLIISGLFLTGVVDFSIISEEQFDDCRIIKEGDVCDDYTECFYSSNEDASCIKGYKDLTLPEDFDYTPYGTQVEVSPENDVGPDGKADDDCTPSAGYDWCEEDYWNEGEVRLEGENVIATSYNGKLFLTSSSIIEIHLDAGDETYTCDSEHDSDTNFFGVVGCYLLPGGTYQDIDFRDYAIHDGSSDPTLYGFDSDGDYDPDATYGGDWSDVSINFPHFNTPIRECYNDGHCLRTEYCDDSNALWYTCEPVVCSYEVIDHVCTTNRFPAVCTSAGITEYPPCVTYMIEYADDLSATIPDLMDQIDQLELDIADKQAIIDTLTADLEDLGEDLSALQLTQQEQATIIFWLNMNISQQATLISELNLTIQQQADLILLLEATDEEKQEIIDFLYQEIADLQALIDAMEETLDENEVLYTTNQGFIIEFQDEIWKLENEPYVFDFEELWWLIQEHYVVTISVLAVLLLSVWAVVKTKRTKK